MTVDLHVELEVQSLEDLGQSCDDRILRASGRAWAPSPLMLAAPVLIAGSARVPAVTVCELAAGPTGPGWSADFRVPGTVAAAAESWAVETAPAPPLTRMLSLAPTDPGARPILGARPSGPSAGRDPVPPPGAERVASAPVSARAWPAADRPAPGPRLVDSSRWAALLPQPRTTWAGEHAAFDGRDVAPDRWPPAAAPLSSVPPVRVPDALDVQPAAAPGALEEAPQTIVRLERRITELNELAATWRAADARRVAEAEARADAAELRVQDAERAAALAVEAQAAAEAALRTQAAGHALWVAEQDERANAHADALRRLDVALAERDEARARADALLGAAAQTSPVSPVVDEHPPTEAPSAAFTLPEEAEPPHRLVEAEHRGVWGELSPSFPHGPPPRDAPQAAAEPPSSEPAEPEPGADPGEDATEGAQDHPDVREACAPDEQPAPPSHPASAGHDLRRPVRRSVGVGILAGAGVLLTADAIVAAVWQEPLSAGFTAHEQTSLRQEERELAVTFERNASEPLAGQSAGARMAQLAVSLRREVEPGEAIGRLTIPRLDDEWVVVEGTEPRQLRSGPGHAAGSSLPGRPATTVVAGRDATFGAPFRQLGELRPGDELEMQMPYGTFTYRVERSETMDQEAASRMATASGDPWLVLTASGPGDELRVVSARQIDATPRDPAT